MMPFPLIIRYLIGAARSSLKISLMLNMMLFFMRLTGEVITGEKEKPELVYRQPEGK
jgi:hypothetical protein